MAPTVWILLSILMTLIYLILGAAGIAAGAVFILMRTELRPRILGGGLLVVGMLVLLFGWGGGSNPILERSQEAERRQGYALGFGLGEHLKQVQPNSRLLIVRTVPEEPRDLETIKGLREALHNEMTIVDEIEVDPPLGFKEQAAIYSMQRLAEMQATGANVVVSFVGLPVRLDEAEQADMKATLEVWRSAEYKSFQWVLPNPYGDLPPRSFSDGRVLVAVWPKPQKGQGDASSAYLETNGSPTELFNGWFELQTEDAR